jgi:hypothetical protein
MYSNLKHRVIQLSLHIFVAFVWKSVLNKSKNIYSKSIWPKRIFVQSFPGVDVMIKIFCDFCQFSANKLAFFSKINVMVKFLHNLALL